MKRNIPPEVIQNASLIFKEVLLQYDRRMVLKSVFLIKIQQAHIPVLSKIAKEKNTLLKVLDKKHEIFIFEDNSYFGCWLNNAKQYYNHIEDGLNSFKLPKIRNNRIKIYDYIYKLLGISWDYWGTSKFIKSIEVNENKNLRIKHNNIIEQNRELMFKKLSPEQINVIANIFNYHPLENVGKERKTLLLTQPLSEDNLISHEKKIRIYKHLVKTYAVGQLYIKIHPREREDYSKFFPDAHILGNSKIPAEIYQLTENFCFNRTITVFSTAIESISCSGDKIIKSQEWMRNFDDSKET